MKTFIKKLLYNILVSYVLLMIGLYIKNGNLIKLTEVEVHLAYLFLIIAFTCTNYLFSSDKGDKKDE
ncbi:hypothetical protein HMPREF9302_07435 [Prevotella amnii DNF00058]|uniref:Uncharacterized protein n=1 Tax=Prevotella amnii DNF00058 TaxID=1401066 RepID=A0A096D1P6_9BACT|nr:hypothetical protein HMPREF9302_07435 [Prevotella amnii DNF00058]